MTFARYGELYTDYREYCAEMGEYTRSPSDFKAALEGAGFETQKKNVGVIVYGLKIARFL